AASRGAGDGNVFTLRDVQVNTGACMCLHLACVEHLLDISEGNQGPIRTHHSLLRSFVYSIFLNEHRQPALPGKASLISQSDFTESGCGCNYPTRTYQK